MTSCSFCGKSQADVRVIVTSAKSAICDECVFVAFDIIGSQKGYLYQRVAYWMYRVVATAGQMRHYRRKRIRKTLRVTPAMEAGIADDIWELDDIARLAS